jgi:hypothetical protein
MAMVGFGWHLCMQDKNSYEYQDKEASIKNNIGQKAI